MDARKKAHQDTHTQPDDKILKTMDAKALNAARLNKIQNRLIYHLFIRALISSVIGFFCSAVIQPFIH
jgi:hypothetical protein